MRVLSRNLGWTQGIAEFEGVRCSRAIVQSSQFGRSGILESREITWKIVDLDSVLVFGMLALRNHPSIANGQSEAQKRRSQEG